MDTTLVDMPLLIALSRFIHLPITFASGVAFAGVVLAALGLLQGLFGLAFLARFLRRARRERGQAQTLAGPAISVLKPLHGDEPLLEAALASFFAQD